MKLLHRLIVGSVLIAVPWVGFSQGAEDANTSELIKQLQRRIDELEQKVKALESKQAEGAPTNPPAPQQRIEELDQKVKALQQERDAERESETDRVKALPTVSLGLNGLVIRSADSNFLMNVHGYAQADARFYVQDHNPANDTFLLRRVRPIIE